MEKCDLCDGDLCNGTGTKYRKWHFGWTICIVATMARKENAKPIGTFITFSTYLQNDIIKGTGSESA